MLNMTKYSNQIEREIMEFGYLYHLNSLLCTSVFRSYLYNVSSKVFEVTEIWYEKP